MTVIAAGIGAALAAAVIHFRRAGQRALVVACIAVMAVLVVVVAFSRMDSSGEVSSYGVFAFVIVYFALDYRGRKAVEDKKLVLTARVPDDGAAVEYLGKDSVWVLVSVDVHTESAGAAAQDSRYRTRVVLDKAGDRWLVSRLERVG